MSKSMFKSKTFWVNILGGVVEGGQLLMQLHVVPPGTVTVVLAIANILLRRITSEPTHFVTPNNG